eukprot:6187843-Pleurochrysis_carterae.AAC.3
MSTNEAGHETEFQERGSGRERARQGKTGRREERRREKGGYVLKKACPWWRRRCWDGMQSRHACKPAHRSPGWSSQRTTREKNNLYQSVSAYLLGKCSWLNRARKSHS